MATRTFHLLSAAVVVCGLCLPAARATTWTYGAIVDAGSSGSRLSLYQWPQRTFHALPPSVTEPSLEVKLLAGVHTHAKPGVNAESGRDALTAMLQKASAALNDEGVDASTVPLFLKATAGLRILTSAERESAIADVRSRLADVGFYFKPEWARVISGEEEGVFGWITVNFFQNTLNSGSDAWAAIDVGGASTQLTVPPKVDLLSNLFNLRLGATYDVNLYTHSLLYYGQDQFRKRMNALVANQAYLGMDKALVAVSPHGVDAEPAADALVDNPCYCPSTTGIPGFKGTGDYKACAALATQLMYKHTECLTDPVTPSDEPTSCSVNGVYLPPIVGNKFFAFSSVSYLYEALQLQPDVPLETLEAAVSDWCATDFGVLVNRTGQPANYTRDYCHSGSYIVTLLTVGYNISKTDPGVVYVVPSNKENDNKYSYALGAMFFDSNAMAWKYQGGSSSTTYKTATIALAIVAAVLLIAVCLLVVRRRKQHVASAQEMTEPMLMGAGAGAGAGASARGPGYP